MEFLDSWFKRLFVGRTWSEVKPPPGRIVHRLPEGFFCLFFCSVKKLKFLYFSFYFFQLKRHFFFCWPYTIILTSILVQGELMELQANFNFFPPKDLFLGKCVQTVLFITAAKYTAASEELKYFVNTVYLWPKSHTAIM